MKKVFLLLLLTAMLGGYQFLDMSTSKKANIAQSTPRDQNKRNYFKRTKTARDFENHF
jgi:CDP-diacylglycerol pyrophosphatase